MRKNYKRLGGYIQTVDERNIELLDLPLVGLSISKQFIKSVANTIGTDLSAYKIINKNQFACSLMQVSRDEKIPIAMFIGDKAIMSPAYPIFEVIDSTLLLPEYLMMWFARIEFDRQASYYAVGGVRGNLSWEDFCDMQLPIPPIEKQREIVKEFKAVQNRIDLNNQLIQKLEETAQAIYKEWFVEFEFPHSPPLEGWPKAGVVENAYSDEHQKMHPKAGVVEKRNAKNYFALPYNPILKERARELRKAGNLAEVLFWKQVRNKSFKGLDFDRQKIIGNYIVDFYCPNFNVVIEIDGSSHDDKQEYDALRDEYLKSLGLVVIHITDFEVKENMDAVMQYLNDHPAFSKELKVVYSVSEPELNVKYSDFQDAMYSDHPGVREEMSSDHPGLRQGLNTNHPGLRPPLQKRGMGYKSSGGEMVWNEELGKEIPKGWENITVKDFCVDMKSGGTPSRINHEYWNSNDVPWLKTGEIKNNIILSTEEYISNEGLKNSSAKLLPRDTVLMSMYGVNAGEIGILKFESSTNQACCGMICESAIHSAFLYYHLLHNQEFIASQSIGGAQENLSKDFVEKIPLLKPTVEILKFNGLKLIIDNKELLTKEIQKLTELRDLLLSKLATIEN